MINKSLFDFILILKTSFIDGKIVIFFQFEKIFRKNKAKLK